MAEIHEPHPPLQSENVEIAPSTPERPFEHASESYLTQDYYQRTKNIHARYRHEMNRYIVTGQAVPAEVARKEEAWRNLLDQARQSEQARQLSIHQAAAHEVRRVEKARRREYIKAELSWLAKAVIEPFRRNHD